MQAYRLVKKRYADDPLSPQGAKLYGGRWNSKGNGAVYAADSVALAVLEVLVHLLPIPTIVTADSTDRDRCTHRVPTGVVFLR